MADPILPFGEYKPDVSDYEGIASQAITNVVPRGDGYGPFQDHLALTKSLPAACRGFFSARKSDGTIQTFAGTSNKLYQLSNTDFSWTDVSRGAGTYGALSANANWTFVQFGNLVFATQANDVLQVFNLIGGTAFANETGSPPQAAYVAVVGQFLVLLGLQALPFRMQWSGLGDPTNWTAGINQSDFQDFTDGGVTQGAAGGEYGVIFQATVIRQMTYAPGSSYIFQITRICEDQGLLAPYSVIKAASQILFLSGQGFQMMTPGSLPTPIGKERINRSFFAEWDSGNPQLMIGANDPNATRVYFGYKSANGSVGLMDTVLAYDYVLDRWSPFHGLSQQFIATASQPGLTLENLDIVATTTIAIVGAVNNGSGKVRLTVATINLPPMVPALDGAPSPAKLATGMQIDIWNVGGTTEANGENQLITVVDSTHIDLPNVSFVHAYTSGGIIAGPIDAMTQSLDNFAVAGFPQIAGFNSSAQFGFFNGPNLEAKLESSEKGDVGTRLFVTGFRPVTDAPTAVGSVSQRENLQSTRVYSPELALTSSGFIPCSDGNGSGGISTRYARGRLRIPYGSTWTYAMGIEPEAVLDGTHGGSVPAMFVPTYTLTSESGIPLTSESGVPLTTP
jgi:hypothetical protein